MLVIMKYRNIYLFLQLALNFKAARSRDILQVNAAERRRDILSDIYNLIYILSFQTDREGVDPGEFLKQQGFSVHNRNGRQTSDIAQSEHCGSVADDCHGIALIGIFIDVFRVFVDFPARFRYSRRIGRGQIILVCHFHLAGDFHLPPVFFVHFQRLFIIIHGYSFIFSRNSSVLQFC